MLQNMTLFLYPILARTKRGCSNANVACGRLRVHLRTNLGVGHAMLSIMVRTRPFFSLYFALRLYGCTDGYVYTLCELTSTVATHSILSDGARGQLPLASTSTMLSPPTPLGEMLA